MIKDVIIPEGERVIGTVDAPVIVPKKRL